MGEEDERIMRIWVGGAGEEGEMVGGEGQGQKV